VNLDTDFSITLSDSSSATRRHATMELQTIRPNLVQAIRAYRVDELMQAAATAGQHFLYANLSAAQSKQDVLDGIAAAFTFPAHFGKNLDALYDCAQERPATRLRGRARTVARQPPFRPRSSRAIARSLP
jgi:hypothetical protein